jgi:glucose/mannose-6-phosphate isomerase
MGFNRESIERMEREVAGFTDDLEAAVSADSGITRGYGRVLICGMGASAIGGEILANSLYYSSRISVETARTMALPSWIDDDTLVVACSYSGNTFETVSIYEMAVAAGLDTVAVTAGGRLGELAAADGSPLMRIGGDPIQPRSALGWFIGMLTAIIGDAGGPDQRDYVRSILPDLRRYDEGFAREGSLPRRIAEELDGRTPIIYGVPNMAAAAMRWKTQINENSKLLAFNGVMPEFNHNEIIGWCRDPGRSRFLPIILNERSDAEIAKTLNAALKALEDSGVSPIVVETEGGTLLERTIHALMMGDRTSLYLAEALDTDPLNVDPIVSVKRHLMDECGRDGRHG